MKRRLGKVELPEVDLAALIRSARVTTMARRIDVEKRNYSKERSFGVAMREA